MDIINISEDIQMTSLEVVDLINRFEVETLESVEISTKSIFGLSSYDDGIRNYAMYILKRIYNL